MHLKFLIALLTLSACNTDPANTANPPRCDGSPRTLCDQNAVWDCPPLSPADQEIRDTMEADCNATEDPVGCLIAADFPLIDMVLVEDCGAADQVCVDDVLNGIGSCEAP